MAHGRQLQKNKNNFTAFYPWLYKCLWSKLKYLSNYWMDLHIIGICAPKDLCWWLLLSPFFFHRMPSSVQIYPAKLTTFPLLWAVLCTLFKNKPEVKGINYMDILLMHMFCFWGKYLSKYLTSFICMSKIHQPLHGGTGSSLLAPIVIVVLTIAMIINQNVLIFVFYYVYIRMWCNIQ